MDATVRWSIDQMHTVPGSWIAVLAFIGLIVIVALCIRALFPIESTPPHLQRTSSRELIRTMVSEEV